MMNNLLATAYGVALDQITGPKWISDYTDDDSNGFAITATMPKDTTPEQFQLMLRNLLADRFHLVVHRESKGFPGYEFTVAPGGSKLKEAPPKDTAVDTGLRGPRARDANGFSLRLPGSSGQTSHPRPDTWGMVLSGNRQSMAQFTPQLGRMINESNGADLNTVVPRVVDKTGLTGVYEFTLGLAGIDVLSASLRGEGSPGGATDAPDPGEIGPTLFTALEKQLGLELTKVKDVPVDMLIVDHVDKTPTGN